jgi:hypothetical protein
MVPVKERKNGRCEKYKSRLFCMVVFPLARVFFNLGPLCLFLSFLRTQRQILIRKAHYTYAARIPFLSGRQILLPLYTKASNNKEYCHYPFGVLMD